MRSSVIQLPDSECQLKSDQLGRTAKQLNDRLQGQASISDGTYRIKSNTDELYLTSPQNTPGKVFVHESDQLGVSQRVRHLIYPDQCASNN